MRDHRELVQAIILDMLMDIRCAREIGDESYRLKVCSDVRRLWKVRHTVRLDRYGWPIMNPPIGAHH